MLKVRLFVAPVLMFCAIGIVACQPAPKKHQHRAIGEVTPFEGNLVSEIEGIYSENNLKFAEACERARVNDVKEIALALDSRKTQIAQSATQSFAESTSPKVRWGQIEFYNSPSTPGENRWIQMVNKWSDHIDLYKEIKNRPDDSRWSALNSGVRSIIRDDQSRFSYQSNMTIDRNSGAVVAETRRRILSCVSESNCLSVEVTPEIQVYLRGGLHMRQQYEDFLDSTKQAFSRRQSLISLLSAIEGDLERVRFHKTNIFRVEAKTLKIPMNVSVFGTDATKFKTHVENTWNKDPEYKIEVELQNLTNVVYQVLVDLSPGGRASVNYWDYKVNLFNHSDLYVISHEMGHVIGIKDTYFTKFDSTNCSYTTEYNPGDIMSTADSGQVLPEHWTQIKEAYF